MTIERAKEIIHILLDSNDNQDVVDALAVIDEALEKQIPKKPMEAPKLTMLGIWYCPTCLRYTRQGYILPKLNFCEQCGQSFDWGKQVTRPTHKVEDIEDGET